MSDSSENFKPYTGDLLKLLDEQNECQQVKESKNEFVTLDQNDCISQNEHSDTDSCSADVELENDKTFKGVNFSLLNSFKEG